jgi:hypothetical protein
LGCLRASAVLFSSDWLNLIWLYGYSLVPLWLDLLRIVERQHAGIVLHERLDDRYDRLCPL